MPYKIATVLDSWDTNNNGTVVSTKRFIQQLKGKGYQFNILATGYEMEGKTRFPCLNLPFLNHLMIKNGAPLGVPNRKKINQALEGCELLHVQYPFLLGRAAVKAARKKGIPVVCSFHVQPENVLLNLGVTSEWLVSLMYKAFIHLFYNAADHVICPSPFAAEQLRKHGVTQPIHVLSNGVPDAFLEPYEAPVEKNDRYKILSVGRFAREKHQDLLIQAVARSRFQDKIELVLVGSGQLQDELEQLASTQLSCPYSIARVDDETLIEHYRTADVFVHAGEIELEGMSVMEAMAHGKAVVVSDSSNSAANSFAIDERSLFNFPDIDNLADRIDHWLENTEERLAAGQQNHDYVKLYSHAACCNQLDALYKQILKHPLASVDNAGISENHDVSAIAEAELSFPSKKAVGE